MPPFLDLAQLSQGPNQILDSALDLPEVEVVLDLPKPSPERVNVWLVGSRMADVISNICYGEQG